MEENLIKHEYIDELAFLKKFFLGKDNKITNKQFYNILKNVFEVQYSKKIVSINEISEANNVEINIVRKIVEGLNTETYISYMDYSFYGNLINVSEYSEDERLKIVEMILNSQEENAKLLIKFKPEELLSEKGIIALNEYINKEFFLEKIDPILYELREAFNPNFSTRYEYVWIAEEYRDRYKKDNEFKKLFEPKCYIVKEDGNFLKLYDPDSLQPIFSNVIKINKDIIIRKAYNFKEGEL